MSSDRKEPDENPFDVPKHLVEEIIRGRCVAFVGAGFSYPVAGTWKELLCAMQAQLNDGAGEPRADETTSPLGPLNTAMDFEMAGELLRRQCEDGPAGSSRFEGAVQSALQALKAGKSQADLSLMNKRSELLGKIPFSSVLTLNMDATIDGSDRKQDSFRAILREPMHWWERSHWSQPAGPRERVIKLHGDANGDPGANPVVLAKTDYRRLLYEDGRYANFLRSVFATQTVLYLGFSFTDAYINELRSEVLSCVGVDPVTPSGYAVMPDASDTTKKLFRDVEGIEVLGYEVKNSGQDHGGFDKWLQAIHDRTEASHRLRHLLGDGTSSDRSVIWIDPDTQGNAPGYAWLQKAQGEVKRLDRAAELRRDEHASAQLIITNFGYRGAGDSGAFDVLDAVRDWPERPPVIVFASGRHAPDNRLACLRRGAWEYAYEWPELFECIERLFGRKLGHDGKPGRS